VVVLKWDKIFKKEKLKKKIYLLNCGGVDN
jgi:hypothetical protein